jgi:ComF family protein
MLSQIFRGLINLVLPDYCEVCGTPLVKGEREICLLCLYNLPRTRFWDEPDNEVEKLFWGKIAIEHACSLFFYRKGSAYRPLIHKLKYGGRKGIGVRLGEELGDCLHNADSYSDIDLLVPVPLHPKKERRRGYNQSACIASGIATAMNLPVERNNLVRRKYTETQTRKTRLERWSNTESVFGVNDGRRFENKHILLVDDIITTGSTVEACAKALLDSCSCKVSVATLGYATS